MCLKRWIGIGGAVLTWLWRIHREPSAIVMKGGEGGFARRVWRDSGPSVQQSSCYHTIDEPLACWINALAHPARLREGQLWGRADASKVRIRSPRWTRPNGQKICDTFPERSPGNRRTRVLAEHIVYVIFTHQLEEFKEQMGSIAHQNVQLLFKKDEAGNEASVSLFWWHIRDMLEDHTLFFLTI